MFVVDWKKDEVIGVITTHILREIHFHTNDINCPHLILKKQKNLFDKLEEVM